MVIPAVHGDLHKTNACLAETTGEQAGTAVFVGRLFADAVELFRGLGFLREIDQIRRGGLHAKGGFQAVDHALHAGIGVILRQQSAVHALDEIKAPPLRGVIGRGIGEEGDGGIAHLRGQRHGRALMRSRQEGGAVVPRVDAGMDGEKGGQVLVFGAEAVADPGAE